MTHITLVCAAGMSTSMLTNKMRAAAEKKGLEITIEAMAESAFASYNGPTEVLLLGPQVSYLFQTLKDAHEPKGIKVAVINMVDYGMMNGEKVLTDALALL